MNSAIFLSCLAGVLGVAAWANWPMERLRAGAEADRILVEKARRRLHLMSGTTVLKSYRIALGRCPVGPKEREGDNKTPEGVYRIVAHQRASAFHRALRISYPETRDTARARARGISPGGDIMIHGIRNGLGFLGRAHRWSDWTAGCIAVTDPEIEEIWKAVPDGTPIEIRK